MWYSFLKVAMVVVVLFIENTSEAECPFSSKNFGTLGRHTWRCKSNAAGRDGANHAETISLEAHRIIDKPGNSIVPISQPRASIRSIKKESATAPEIKDNRCFVCYCGRKFKSFRALSRHRRTCCIQNVADLRDLIQEQTTSDQAEDEEQDEGPEGPTITRPRGSVLPGV